MAKVTVTPMLGHPKPVRLDSLTGCHALFEKAEYINGMPGNLGVSLESAIKKILTTPHAREQMVHDSKVSLIITLEL